MKQERETLRWKATGLQDGGTIGRPATSSIPSAPLVSVILPTHNRGHLIARAISSVLAQTIPEVEVLVIDDGSTDQTPSVVAGFGDSRIHYLRHESNRGVSAARNTGLEAAGAEYIGFLDSDDEWLPDKTERQLEMFERSPLGPTAVTGGYIVADKLSRTRGILPLQGVVFEQLLAFKYGIIFPTLMIRNLESGLPRFDEGLRAFVDLDWMLQLPADVRFDYAHEPVCIVHHHSGARVTNVSNHIQARQRLAGKYDRELKSRPRTRSIHYFCLGRLFLKERDVARARCAFYEAWKTHPSHLLFAALFLASCVNIHTLAISYATVVAAARIRETAVARARQLRATSFGLARWLATRTFRTLVAARLRVATSEARRALVEASFEGSRDSIHDRGNDV